MKKKKLVLLILGAGMISSSPSFASVEQAIAADILKNANTSKEATVGEMVETYGAAFRAFNHVITLPGIPAQKQKAAFHGFLNYAQGEINHQTGGEGFTHWTLTEAIAVTRNHLDADDVADALRFLNNTVNSIAKHF